MLKIINIINSLSKLLGSSDELFIGDNIHLIDLSDESDNDLEYIIYHSDGYHWKLYKECIFEDEYEMYDYEVSSVEENGNEYIYGILESDEDDGFTKIGSDNVIKILEKVILD